MSTFTDDSRPLDPREQFWQHERQLADLDQLIARVRNWANSAPDWEPFRRGRTLIERLSPELDKVRLHLDSVLVVGLVGGTGVGKSTLINALIGRNICPAGSERRPTTLRPAVVCRPEVDVDFLRMANVPLDVHPLDDPLLAHLMLIDCPDPDTQSTDGPDDNRNRDLLRAILPHCDVIIYVGSQQKYRSQAVEEELMRHAHGRRLLFVQSQADRDEDIRDDWRVQLESRGIRVPEIFCLDALSALKCKQSGKPVDPEFLRFTRLVEHELANRARYRIKRANTLELCDWMLNRIREMIGERKASLVRLADAMTKQQAELRAQVRRRLSEHLRSSRYLWRSKLLDEVQLTWGGGPLAGFFRLLSGFGAIARWALVARSRSATQLAVASATAATLAVRDRWTAYREAQSLAASDVLGISESDIAQARSILDGYAADAGLDDMLGAGREREVLSQQALAELATEVQASILSAIESEAHKRVVRRAGPSVHWLLELIFLLIPAYLVFQLGRNFFYDHPWGGRPLLSLEFVVHGVLWIFVVGWVLRGVLLWVLGLGLRDRIASVVDQAVGESILRGLTADWAMQLERVHQHVAQLSAIEQDLSMLKHQLGQLEDVRVGALVGLENSGRRKLDEASARPAR